jgi:hypothetical protein
MLASPSHELGPPPLMNEVSRFSFDDHHERTSRSTTDIIRLAMGSTSPMEAKDDDATLLQLIPPPQPRMHSDLHPHDYERMASILQLTHRSQSNSPKAMSREHSYISPSSSRASSILSTQGQGDARSSVSKLHAQLAALRAKRTPRPVGVPSDHLTSGSYVAEKRRVQSYTSGSADDTSTGGLTRDHPQVLARDQMLMGGQGSQTNLKVSMRRAVFARRSWQLGPGDDDEAEVEEEPGAYRTSLTRREVTTHSAVCLGPRLSNSRSVRLMMQMGLLRSQSKKRESYGNKIVPVVERNSAGAVQTRKTPPMGSSGQAQKMPTHEMVTI